MGTAPNTQSKVYGSVEKLISLFFFTSTVKNPNHLIVTGNTGADGLSLIGFLVGRNHLSIWEFFRFRWVLMTAGGTSPLGKQVVGYCKCQNFNLPRIQKKTKPSTIVQVQNPSWCEHLWRGRNWAPGFGDGPQSIGGHNRCTKCISRVFSKTWEVEVPQLSWKCVLLSTSAQFHYIVWNSGNKPPMSINSWSKSFWGCWWKRDHYKILPSVSEHMSRLLH